MAYRHIILPRLAIPVSYKARKGFTSPLPIRQDIQHHARNLLRRFNAAFPERPATPSVMIGRQGVFVTFTLDNAYIDLAGSLARERSGIQLRNVRRGSEVFSATVFIPFDKRCIFVNAIERFLHNLDSGIEKPKGAVLVSGIEDIKAAVLDSFWQDEDGLMPRYGDASVWCEIWLQRNPDNSEFDVFSAAAHQLNIELRSGKLTFPERSVVLCKATREQLDGLILYCPDIAEFRRFRETSRHFVVMHPQQQAMLARRLNDRTRIDADSNVSVCVLDSGANNGHMLLQRVLAVDDCIAAMPSWTADDWKGHGTCMCGMTAYGDLTDVLQSPEPISIHHKLESVKVWPQNGNPPELYAAVTENGVYRIEIAHPERKRVMCLAVAEDDPNCKANGAPSSWSAAIDQLAWGAETGIQRLFFVSAGNAEWYGITADAYCSHNRLKPVESPGQSWNAITVGAYTEKVRITDPALSGYRPLAASGELSPHSATSAMWDKQWPIKPDIVMEGGNFLVAPDGSVDTLEDVSLLSTSKDLSNRTFECFDGTSAATALAAKFAAELRVEYPDVWPETIRGLMVHSARWTDPMFAQFCQGSRAPTKCQFQQLVRICGYGVPNRERALYCKRSALTMIAEGELQPYKLEGSAGKMNQMHLYKLPWPRDILMGLRDRKVKMRVTLSYFVEPSPGERGWLGKYRYASHGLRFAVNGPLQTQDDFLKTVNQAIARSEDEDNPGLDSFRWRIGRRNDTAGSVHSDFMEEPAEDIAQCNMIAVYPIIGWWRERPKLGKVASKARYSLIVSLETPEETTDIYTPVAVQVGIPTPIEVPIS